MDGIRIKSKRALVNKLATAIGNSKDTQPVQQEWLVELIDVFFVGRCNEKKWWDYSQKDLIEVLRHNGVADSCITDKSNNLRRSPYNRGDDYMSMLYDVTFNNFTVSFNSYRGGNCSGSYRGINARFFGIYHSIDLRFMPVEMAAATLIELDTLIPQWKEKLWPEILLEAQKVAKMKSINENTIEALIKQKLTSTGITYHIEKQKLRVKVYFNIGCDMQIEWYLSHKSFMQQIDCVIDTVKTIKKTAEATTTTFCVKKIDKSICWQ